MSAIWKRWLVSSSLVCGLACGDSGGGGAIDDGGDTDGDKDANNNLGDASLLDGGRRDGGRRDATTTPPTGDGGEQENCGALMAKIRDFTPQTSSDFETFSGGGTKGIVKDSLDSEHLPVFNEAKGQVTSKTTFDQWYRDVDGVNEPIAVTIPNMAGDPSSQYSYSSSAFFPIDGKGFGNYPNSSSSHNFHFTTQIAASFTYKGGEKFEFEGDDDLWIFVNDKLALDLGGLHSALKGTIDFDAQAATLGIEKGKTYRMDIFHAERHTTESNFKFSTTISCFMVPPVLI